MKKIIFAFIIFGLLACAGPLNTQFVKPGVTPEEFSRDVNDCFAKSYGENYDMGNVPANHVERRRNLERCMKAKGYTYTLEK